MPRGDKSKYTDKQQRKADHIAEGYEEKGVSEYFAFQRPFAMVEPIVYPIILVSFAKNQGWCTLFV